MQVPTSNGRRGIGANMTPMIDVVFLLIIFFLVSSHLARQETRLPLDLPTAQSHDPLDVERASLTVSVDAGGNWLIRGKQVDSYDLRAALRNHRTAAGSDASIRIRSEGEVQYRFVAPVLREAALAGVTDASVAVRDEAAP